MLYCLVKIPVKIIFRTEFKVELNELDIMIYMENWVVYAIDRCMAWKTLNNECTFLANKYLMNKKYIPLLG